MSAGAIRLAKGQVEVGLNDSAMDRGLNAARAKLASFGASVAGWGARLVGLGLSMASPFVYAVNAASNAAETLNKFEAVFGDQATAADQFAKNLGASIGRGTTEIRNGMSALMAQFVGLGFGRDEARKMSEEMTSLLYDFGSFFNISDEESLSRFISAMSGSSEVLDQFGVNIKAAALDQEFLRMGLRVTTANATEQQKALARFNIIKSTMQSQGAVGDAVKTADSFANTLKRVKAQVVDAAEAIGTALLMPMGAVLGILANGIAGFAAWARENQMAVAGVAAGIASIIGAGTALVTLGGAAYVASIGLGVLTPFISLAAGGFGLLTAATWAWSLATGIGAAAIAGMSALWGIYTSGTGMASAGLVLYSLWTWISTASTAALTGGINLLIGSLVAVGLAAGGILLLGGALVGVAAAVATLGVSFGEWHGSLGFLDTAISGILDAASGIWDWIAASPLGSFVDSAIGMIGSLWGSVSDVFDSVAGFLVDSGIASFLGNVALVIAGVAGLGVALTGLYLKWLYIDGGLIQIFTTIRDFFSGDMGTQGAFALLAGLWNFQVQMWGSLFRLFADAFAVVYAPLIQMGQGVRDLGSQAVATAGRMMGALSGAAGHITTSFSSAFSATTAGFTSMFSSIVGIGGQAFGALKDAYSAGDWGLIWSTIKVAALLAWEEVSFFAMTTFNTWKDVLIDTFTTVWTTLRILFNEGWAFLESGWHRLVASMLGSLLAPMQAALALLEPGSMAHERLAAMIESTNLERLHGRAISNAEEAEARGNVRREAMELEAWIGEQEAWLLRNARDHALRAGHDAEAARLQIEMDEVADLARFNANLAYLPDDLRADAMELRGLRDMAREAGNDEAADEHQAALDRLWEAAEEAQQQALFDMDRLRVAGDVSGTVANAKGVVQGSFNAQAIFGMLGSMAAESPAVRAARLQQETNELLRQHTDLLREVRAAAGARRS